jgi:hypothetical protein
VVAIREDRLGGDMTLLIPGILFVMLQRVLKNGIVITVVGE